MAEVRNRTAQRHRCWLKALFVFNEGRSTLDAIVRNLSESGALLECEQMQLLPQEFDLIITKSDGELLKHRAHQVWRLQGAIGVKFIDDSLDGPRSPSSMARAS